MVRKGQTMKNKVYTYKDRIYVVMDNCSMKDPVSREWLDAVIYSPLIDGIIQDIKYVREKTDFIKKFKKKDIK